MVETDSEEEERRFHEQDAPRDAKGGEETSWKN